jgi:hypothetical protein
MVRYRAPVRRKMFERRAAAGAPPLQEPRTLCSADAANSALSRSARQRLSAEMPPRGAAHARRPRLPRRSHRALIRAYFTTCAKRPPLTTWTADGGTRKPSAAVHRGRECSARLALRSPAHGEPGAREFHRCSEMSQVPELGPCKDVSADIQSHRAPTRAADEMRFSTRASSPRQALIGLDEPVHEHNGRAGAFSIKFAELPRRAIIRNGSCHASPSSMPDEGFAD